jgi:cyclopropane-fatty-acyl-phospholipid synthase
MWEFYLAGCEVSFRYMNQMVFQIQIAKRQDAVPLTRDYMAETERREGTAPSMAAE